MNIPTEAGEFPRLGRLPTTDLLASRLARHPNPLTPSATIMAQLGPTAWTSRVLRPEGSSCQRENHS